MKLEYHKNCTKAFPHKPEITMEISSLEEAEQISKTQCIENMYVNWNLPSRSLLHDGEWQIKNGAYSPTS